MKQMIWSSYDLLDETAKEEYQNSQREILDDDSYEVSDEEWAEEVYCRLDDERSNLNKEVDGIIVVFGNLGLPPDSSNPPKCRTRRRWKSCGRWTHCGQRGKSVIRLSNQ